MSNLISSLTGKIPGGGRMRPEYIPLLLGGSHETFEFLVEKSGNFSHLLAHFVSGLKSFRSCGPPKLSNCPMTIQEELFSKTQNACDTDQIDVKALVNMELAEHEIQNNVEQLNTETKSTFLVNNQLAYATYCQDCSLVDWHSTSPTLQALTSDVRIWELKGLMKQVESSGLDIEYRCVRCRSCSQCKDAEMTDKISLREVQELQQCMDSVELDTLNKSVRVTLPLRGSEVGILV